MPVEGVRFGDHSSLNQETWEARKESPLVAPHVPFTVVTWNIYEGSDPGVIGDQLVLMDPAIAILQQVSRAQLDEFGERFPQFHGSFIETAYHRSGLVEGNLTLSQFPIVDSYYKILHQGARAPWKGGRSAYQFYFETKHKMDDNRYISIANVRAARLSLSGLIAGGAETQILLDIIKKRLPDILGGDISSLPKWKRMQQILTETNLRNTGPNLNEKTWVGGKKLRLERGLTRADYLLASEGVVFDGSVAGKPFASDHKPIIGKFALLT